MLIKEVHHQELYTQMPVKTFVNFIIAKEVHQFPILAITFANAMLTKELRH